MNIAQLHALENIEVNCAAYARIIEQTLGADAALVGNPALTQAIRDAIIHVGHVEVTAQLLQAHIVVEGEAEAWHAMTGE